MKRWSRLFSGLGALVIGTSAIAQTWDDGGSGSNWTTSGNWSPNGAPANNGTADVNFPALGSFLGFGGGTSSNVNVPWDIDSLTFGGAILSSHTMTGQTLTIRDSLSASSVLGTVTMANNIVTPNTLDISAVGSGLTLNGNISGSGGIAYSSGVLNLNGTNTYAGTTTVNSGTLNLNGQLQNTSEVVVNGGTLALGASNRINDSAGLTLDGGTFKTNGHSENLGTLTLSGSATLDFGSGSSAVNFSSADYQGGVLTISNYDADHDQIAFTGTPSQAFLDNIFWSHVGIMGGRLEGSEVVPVPEPETYAAATLLALLAAWHCRQRILQS